jgi:hypothetical protein
MPASALSVWQKTAEVVLVEDDIVGLRRQFWNNLRVPGVLDQNPTLASVRGPNRLSDAEPQMPRSVRGIPRTEVQEIGTEAHLQIDDRDTRPEGGSQDAGLYSGGLGISTRPGPSDRRRHVLPRRAPSSPRLQ